MATIPWSDQAFHLGINMAGAVSAGAYTAGVLDFLIEALEEWQKVKDAGGAVPMHDVMIDCFSGASAGGMCAAISSVMLHSQFQHITDTTQTGTTNVFYEAWVNLIDIRKLLATDDVKNGQPLVSLLDSTIIDTIAARSLVPHGQEMDRPYVAKDLTLFLTTTNVRGMTYPLYGNAAGSVNEFTTYYGDRVRFEVVRDGQQPAATDAYPIPVGDASALGDWTFLQTAAMATGAFPMFLAPRILKRRTSDYRTPIWFPVGAKEPVPLPAPILPDTPTVDTLNVDGGVTDNDPFELSHDYLASRNPKAETIECVTSNPRTAETANAAVLTVAPFPTTQKADESPVASIPPLFSMLSGLVSVVMSQSRFLGESLSVLMSGSAFSRFVIAPSDPGQADKDALQCGTLSAFGGFMEREFRAHDFLLGRYNCQQFLKVHFKLPVNNPVISAGLDKAKAKAIDGEVLKNFAGAAPPEADPVMAADGSAVQWMPIIPLIGLAAAPMSQPVRATISHADVETIAGLVIDRVKAIEGPLLQGMPAAEALKVALKVVLLFEKGHLVDLIEKKLAPNVKN